MKRHHLVKLAELAVHLIQQRVVKRTAALQNRVHVRMQSLMAGASLGDWLWACRIPGKVFQYDHSRMAVFPASTLPWPVKYVLTRYNKKFIMTDGRLPSAKMMGGFLERYGLGR